MSAGTSEQMRAQIVALVDTLAAARREMASGAPAEVSDSWNNEADVIERVARIIEGDVTRVRPLVDDRRRNEVEAQAASLGAPRRPAPVIPADETLPPMHRECVGAWNRGEGIVNPKPGKCAVCYRPLSEPALSDEGTP